MHRRVCCTVFVTRVDGRLHDVGHSGQRVLHVDHRVAVFRRSAHRAARQVLRPVHGGRTVQLHSTGVFFIF